MIHSPGPRAIAIIPARGGSKRIPAKNLLPIAGEPLLAHSLRHAREASGVFETWVSTDDDAIAAVARARGARVAPRPPELADDRATSEAALLHTLDYRRQLGLEDPEIFVFLQATSPIRKPGDIDGAIATFYRENADSVFSACENNRLIWAMTPEGPQSITYDYHRRQREQDMPRQMRENGSIYVLKPELLRKTGNRLGGRMAVYEMDYWSSFQIDTPEHIELCDWIMRRPQYRPPVAWPSRLELVIFDFDGVMTDNGVWVDEDGREQARCNRGDGWGIGRLADAGVRMLIVSTERRSIAAARAAKLGLDCHHAISDKGAFLKQLFAADGIDPANVAYVGNDVNDLPAMKLVGFPVAVADSDPAVLRLARLVLERRGGHGAVREFCDRLLEHLAATRGVVKAAP
jgi:YrbI family 3-deoxy-D-manno-octulosonate 8-phosphate phosphatase